MTSGSPENDMRQKDTNPKAQYQLQKLLFEKLQKDLHKSMKKFHLYNFLTFDQFKVVMDDMCFVDIKKMSPIEQSLLNEIWTNELMIKGENE